MTYYNSRVRQSGLPTPPNDMYGYHSSNGQYPCAPARGGAYDSTQYHAPAPAPSLVYNSQAQYGNMLVLPAPGAHRTAHFGPTAQAVLPPLADMTRNLASKSTQHHHAHESKRQNPPVKEEKVALGGVAQELDYEMSEMADYVAEMAQEMYELPRNICLSDIDITRSIMPRSKVSSSFRKNVSGILSSTRLPSSTILLGLNYLSKRIAMMNPATFRASDSTVWHMLTIALLLGSKFLDDNTFQNQSWSEVSGIAVMDLNKMERDWLQQLSWSLHVNAEKDSDFQCWLASWASWKDQRLLARNYRLAPLNQLDTTVRRQSYYNGRQDLSPIPNYMYGQERTPSVYQSQSRYDAQPWSRPASDYSPLSAPETGPNTPVWMMPLPGSGLPSNSWHNGMSAGYRDPYSGRASRAAQTIYPSYPVQKVPNQAYWGGHPADCNCTYCYASEPYFHQTRGYGQQTVVG